MSVFSLGDIVSLLPLCAIHNCGHPRCLRVYQPPSARSTALERRQAVGRFDLEAAAVCRQGPFSQLSPQPAIAFVYKNQEGK